MRFANELGGWIPEVDEDLQTSAPGVWVAGDGGGVAGALVAELEGTLVGLAVALRLQAIDRPAFQRNRRAVLKQLQRLRRFRAGLDRISRIRPGLSNLATPHTLVCRCEELSRAEVDEGIAGGGTDIRSLKRMTRLTMGACQGRMCWPAMARQIDTRVTGLRSNGERIVGVEVGEECVPCQTVVNAAGAWAGRLASTLDLKLPVFPVRGQVVLTETLPHTLYSCLSTTACYLAQKAHGEVLIGSTTERVGFDVSVTHEAVRSLCRGAIQAVPMLKHVRIRRVWAGLRPGTPDELPILGPMSGLGGYINATGGFRTGVVASPLTGQLVAQLVCGETPCVAPQRFLVDRFVSDKQDSRDTLQATGSGLNQL